MNATQSHPVRLYLLQLALAGNGTPVPSYLLQMSDGTYILIDTGVPSDGSFQPMDGSSLQITPVVDQLATLGLTPQDIQYLVCTHFDPDHSGCHDAFPSSELIVQRTHYEFVRATENPRFVLTRSHWNHPDLHYRLIDGDSELVLGVELFETSGHVPGHQAVLVRLPQTGTVLLAIDAAPVESELNPETRLENNGTDLDPTMARTSARKLFELAKREDVVLTVCGHDKVQWRTLKKAPEFYS